MHIQHTTRSRAYTVARHGLAATLALSLAACGGGGGGSTPDAVGGSGSGGAPTGNAGPTPFLVADVPSTCRGLGCQEVKATFLDSSGFAGLFWHSRTGEDAIQFRAASQPSSNSTMGAVTSFSATSQTWPVQVAALGDRRYAVLQLSGEDRTSRVVDMSSTTAPTLSQPVTLTMLRTSQIVSTPSNGAFIVGPDAPAGAIDMGGGFTAQGRPLQAPDGYKALWFSAFSPMAGGPSAYWAFNASKVDPLDAFRTDPRIYLGLLDLQDGWVGTLEDRLGRTWNENIVGSSVCADWNNPRIDVNDYGGLHAVVGWINNKAAPEVGCDIVVDGTLLTQVSASALRKPLLGGSGTGPFAIWEERDAKETRFERSKIVWRARDDRTGAWGEKLAVSTHPFSRITGSATASGGIVAVSWLGCDDDSGLRCTPFLSKVVNGVWSTQSLGKRGPTARFATQLAINIHGDAIALWSYDKGDQCDGVQTEKCGRIFAIRF